MAVAVKKYNPGFLTDDEIIESFCVRTHEFESIVESLREMGSSSSTHSLVIGSRGSGKTHLLLRVAAEVRRDPDLSGIFPVVFAEESYEVGTCGEFWLECLAHLAGQAPEDERDSLRLSYEDLRTVSDDSALAERCLGSLLDFSDRHNVRLLLLVENLNMLFSDMSDPDAGWQLRKTLQTEPRIILLGSATSRFHEIDSPEHALYDLFRVLTLRPLDTAECEALWETVSGKPAVGDTVRPLEILTGGSPRLIAIIARFGADRSFADLMDNLLDLVDEHTEYFKSHLEALPPQERRVYLALARLWKPSTTREIADVARVDTNACSAQLRRLVQRGAVAFEGGTPRRRQYYLTERLYNIYYLLRRGTGTDRLVAIVIEFMRFFYSPSDLGDIFVRLLEDAHISGLLQSAPEQLGDTLISEAMALEEIGREGEALEIYDKVIGGLKLGGKLEAHSQLSWAFLGKSLLLLNIGQARESIVVCDYYLNLVRTRGNDDLSLFVGDALGIKGLALLELGDLDAALHTCDEAMASIGVAEFAEPDNYLVASLICVRGLIHALSNRSEEAIAAFDQEIAQFGTALSPEVTGSVGGAVTAKMLLLGRMGQTVSDWEFSLLLLCLAEEKLLPEGTLEAIAYYTAKVGPVHTLELIQASPASDMLLPLVTALQLELGQSPRVAKEVHEVAQDIRPVLLEAKGSMAATATISSPTLIVGDPERR